LQNPLTNKRTKETSTKSPLKQKVEEKEREVKSCFSTLILHPLSQALARDIGHSPLFH
jgi:hypothetical protein